MLQVYQQRISKGMDVRPIARQGVQVRMRAVSQGQQGSLQTGGVPVTYKRMVASRTGNSFREVAKVVEVPCTYPASDEVLIHIAHAGINGGCETFRARGEHAFRANKDAGEYNLGAEASGVVVAMGDDVNSLKEGDHVVCSSMSGFSEYGIAKAVRCTRVSQSSPEVTALAISGVVACMSIEGVCKVRPGEVVLVTAAAGGTGHLAAQFAQLAGGRVIATCGNSEKAKALEALGLERIIVHTEEDVASVLKAEYPQGIDVVYEGVGGAMVRAAWENLASGGRLLTIGYISDYPHTNSNGAMQPIAEGLPSPQDLFWKGLTVEKDGKTIMGGASPQDLKLLPACRKRTFDLYKTGDLKVWIDRSKEFKGIESIPDAIEHMLQGGHIGKVVVDM